MPIPRTVGGTGSWKLETGSWKLETGNWKLEAGKETEATIKKQEVTSASAMAEKTESTDLVLDVCRDILNRTPPTDGTQNQSNLLALLRSSNNVNAAEELEKRVHFAPLEISTDANAGDRPFICSQFNREGESFRSPWSNSSGNSSSHRRLEILSNEVWDAYRSLYYGRSAVGSVYFFENKESNFLEGCYLMRCATDRGYWESQHKVAIEPMVKSTVHYKIQSALVLALENQTETASNQPSSLSPSPGNSNHIGASLQQETEQSCPVQPQAMENSHVQNLGKIIEQIEIEQRSKVEGLTIPKTRQVAESLLVRQPKGLVQQGHVLAFQQAAMLRKVGPPAVVKKEDTPTTTDKRQPKAQGCPDLKKQQAALLGQAAMLAVKGKTDIS